MLYEFWKDYINFILDSFKVLQELLNYSLYHFSDVEMLIYCWAEIRTIRCALSILESLEAEMIPAIYNCYLDPENPAAQCHLKFLWRFLRDHYDSLQSSLDSIADPVAFCHVGHFQLFILSDQLSLELCVFFFFRFVMND